MDLQTFFATSPAPLESVGSSLWLIIALPLLGAFICGVFGKSLGRANTGLIASGAVMGSFLLSVLWVLGMTNAINLIDGLDGLAAGIVAIAAGAFFLYSMQLTQQGLLQDGNIAPLLSVIVLGMCIGFLPWNFHPARIFMGDGGALMLGVLMAASTMTVGGRVDQQSPGVVCHRRRIKTRTA